MSTERLLVCGGRDFKDMKVIDAVLSELVRKHRVDFIIHGGASGADTTAGAWAAIHGYPVAVVPAHWHHYGRSAGHRRNEWMLRLSPTIVVAFPGGVGTASMVRYAREANIAIIEVPSCFDPS